MPLELRQFLYMKHQSLGHENVYFVGFQELPEMHGSALYQKLGSLRILKDSQWIFS